MDRERGKTPARRIARMARGAKSGRSRCEPPLRARAIRHRCHTRRRRDWRRHHRKPEDHPRHPPPHRGRTRSAGSARRSLSASVRLSPHMRRDAHCWRRAFCEPAQRRRRITEATRSRHRRHAPAHHRALQSRRMLRRFAADSIGPARMAQATRFSRPAFPKTLPHCR